MKRLRIIAWNVQPVCVVDDGDDLTPVNVAPAQIPSASWDDFTAGGWKDHLDALRLQVEEE